MTLRTCCRESLPEARPAPTRTHVLSSGTPSGELVVFIHGNVSSGRFYEELHGCDATARYPVLAPDLRGYGGSDRAPIDATRGMRDFSDDLSELLRHPEAGSTHRKVHLVGWSAGGCVAMQFAIDHPEQVASLVLMAPGSPTASAARRAWRERRAGRTSRAAEAAAPTRSSSSASPPRTPPRRAPSLRAT